MGATLSITATNAGAAALACAIPETASDEVTIGVWKNSVGSSAPASALLIDEDYLTSGFVDESDFRDECKNFTKFRKVFRNEIKTDHRRIGKRKGKR